MNLKQIRRRIDRIDADILKLLHDRMEQALLARRLKSQIREEAREREVLENATRRATGPLDATFVERIYDKIMEESRRIQAADFKLIAFQGEHGAFCELASKAWSESLIAIPCREFAEVFEGVEDGLYDYGIVPVENTLGGNVNQVNERLIHTPLHVVGAVRMPIRLCLMALSGTDHREIRLVYSHVQALSQCRRFLERNALEPVPFYDTAGAARMVSQKRPGNSAAIASSLAAALYGLEILKEGVEDDRERNVTRFLILSARAETGKGDKCSVVFSTEHKAGTLFRVLELFARQGINLTRIESIPDSPGRYAFFLDFMGSDQDPRVQRVLEDVHGLTTEFRFLGSYEERVVA